MESSAALQKSTLLLFFMIIHVSHSHSVDTSKDARHYKSNYNLQANHFTTPASKISEDYPYNGPGANFVDGLGERYLTNIQHSGHSWPTKAKRRWAENSMSVWGKRSNVGPVTRSSPHLRRMWSENSMAVWGKRTNKPQIKETADLLSSSQTHNRQQNEISHNVNLSQPQISKQNSGVLNHQPLHKRRWAENSMSVWGKRVASKNFADHTSSAKTDNSVHQTATRELSANSYSMNSHPDQERLLKILHRKHWEPKRNWATNTMNVWGKRETQEDKQRRTSDYKEDITSDQSTTDA